MGLRLRDIQFSPYKAGLVVDRWWSQTLRSVMHVEGGAWWMVSFDCRNE
jgi:hypothetical protein